MSERSQSEHRVEAWEEVANSPWLQEYGDVVFDGRTVQTAIDPNVTMSISCNVLDEEWLPDLDDERPEMMTVTERIKELYDRLKFLDELEEYQANPNPNMSWKYENREEYEEICRERYRDIKKRLENEPDNQQLKQFANTVHWRLVQFRTYDFLASDPKTRRDEIKYEVKALMASRDERFNKAFLYVDEDAIAEETDILLDKISVEQFDRLAELAERKAEPDQEFTNLARDLASEALGLSDIKIEVQFYTNKEKANGYGSYSENDDGSFTVFCNKRLDDCDEMDDNFIEYADTIAHELRHIKQDLICRDEPESELGKLYAYCNEYYVKCDFDYDKYATQLIEAEAFSFGEGFGERFYNTWINLREAKREEEVSLGHKIIEITEVNNG